jgi:hypothetical protein
MVIDSKPDERAKGIGRKQKFVFLIRNAERRQRTFNFVGLLLSGLVSKKREANLIILIL